MTLWPHHDQRVHLEEMAKFCAAPERFGQFVAYAATDVPQGFVEVALRNDYVNGTSSSPVAFLEGIFVVPKERRRGIARSLIAAAEDWARSRECIEFASNASVSDQLSHALHHAVGFEETERVVYFRKALVPQ